MSFQAKGLLVVLSGPSGCGKSTLCKELLNHPEINFGLVVSHTSRSPREGEQDGVNYHFIDRDQFELNIESDLYLEWARVHDNYYGTPRDQVQSFLDQGVNVLLEIDVQGGVQVKKNDSRSILIFVSPPKFEVLENRLRGRATDSEEVIKKRIKNAYDELRKIPDYDFLVVNDVLEVAVSDLKNILESEKMRVKRLNLEDLSGILQVPISSSNKERNPE